ncbi:cinnamoyl CoA reductase [Canna indica]|uniref:Cinnamoyl CoA reductase n=1 Tax=Canna indica TaxID=4628 RepID=A0AAQ3Q176_9LILI|nr:cinnamoyl CoA reductase [Canna indica]
MMAEKAETRQAEKVGVELVSSLMVGPFMYATISGNVARVLMYMTRTKAYRNTVCSDEVNQWVKPNKFSSQRIQDLKLEFTPIKQSL